MRDAAKQLLRKLMQLLLPNTAKNRLADMYRNIKGFVRSLLNSSNNLTSNELLLSHRHDYMTYLFSHRSTLTASELPYIDISLVTYNSSKWLDDLFASLLTQDYPLNKINLYIVDNASSDDTLNKLDELQRILKPQLHSMTLNQQNNDDFGAAHNVNIRLGNSEFVLVTNPDLTFETDTIVKVVNKASSDTEQTASWELYQRPFEHPKHYDPVTLETAWSSHACVLIRRAAFEQCGGYDERIFLYGEDVEPLYRFRAQGWQLRY